MTLVDQPTQGASEGPERASPSGPSEGGKPTPRRFVVQTAVRQQVSLLLGLVGPSGAGKTFSALRLATGMAGKRPIVLIDTENRRAQHYADQFRFQHIDFAPPYGPLDYLAALQAAETVNPSVVIIDSLSHEHDGEGGTLDCVTAELDRLAGGDPTLQQKLATAAWRRPKAARRALLSGLLRMRAHVILCIRATERTRIAREAVASEPVDLGLTPITAPEFMFELTCSALLRAGAQGEPTWASALQGEHGAIKLPRHFAPMMKGGGPFSETHGQQLARWAAGERLPIRLPRRSKRREGGL